MKALLCLSKSHEQLNNHKQALHYIENLKKVNDSISLDLEIKEIEKRLKKTLKLNSPEKSGPATIDSDVFGQFFGGTHPFQFGAK